MSVCISHTQILTVSGRSQFTLRASLRHLEVEYCESENSSKILSENSSKILRASGFLELFSDLRYSTSQCFKLARKVKQLFSSRHYTDPHSGREKLILFACRLMHLEVEYRESENSSRILRASGFWNCF
jgi:hypothetical protein